MIVKWPGVTQAASTCDKPLIVEDFYPTLLEMAGIEHYKTLQTIDGVSFVPLLDNTGDPSKGRKFYWNFPNLWGDMGSGNGYGPTAVIRDGDWKLIYYYENGKKELFNIREDIGEKQNRIKEQPKLADKLSRQLGKYLRSVDAQRPVFKATGQACPWPDEV